ncbi:hypothetical protein [Brachybacterium sacelli]|uniref:Uncharacterized protein n=1 Tax=Brachybacterium sacelli TaxID=173364 RepID=A0ABS4X2B2_9MICO|nr:hypothetical protein [Brachybacterium sacelli]
MPSYRMHLPVGALRPGTSPVQVEEQAVLALGSRHHVERTDLEAPVLGARRVGRLVLRFQVEETSRSAEDEQARAALAAVIEHVESSWASIAPDESLLLTCGTGGRFRPIPLG